MRDFYLHYFFYIIQYILSRGQHPHRLSQGLTPRLIKFMNIKDFQKDVSLASQTTFKIGGPAKYFFKAKSNQDIIKTVKFAKQNNLPFFILSNGSNVLALDEGYKGLIIKTYNTKYKIQDTKMTAEAGVLLRDLISATAKASLSGLEWAVGIPGRVGGSIYGNSRAFNQNISDFIKEVKIFDLKDFKIKTLTKKECKFSEKESIFKHNKKLIILSATFQFKKDSKEKIKKKIKENTVFRKGKQPLNYPSAGSVFVNLVGQKPSSYLIEKAGLKGKRVGRVQVSEKHAGFIINLGKAKSADVLKLIEIIKEKVKEKFKINLKEEIQIIA